MHGRSRHSTIINPLGPELEHDIERFSDQPMFGSDHYGEAAGGGFAPLHSPAGGLTSDPIYPLQLQSEGQAPSQALRTALEREGRDFLGFIENVAQEKGHPAQEDEDNNGKARLWVDFEQLLEDRDRKRAVVAQVFHHVLSLATKNAIKVAQDGQGGNKPFGAIRLGVEVPNEGMEGGDARDDDGAGEQ